jgi:hypothetical protein
MYSRPDPPYALGFIDKEEVMRKPLGVIIPAIALTLLTLPACKAKDHITQDELVRRTQELVDSVAGGDQTPWKKYFADDAMFFDERG